MGWDALPALFAGLGEPDTWIPLLQRHAAIVERERPRVRVSAVEGDDVIQRQYAESLEIVRIALEATPTPRRLVDVGSGGGFPGMVAACVLPETAVALVEPLQKRARLLEEAAAELGLGNVEVVARRAEDAARGPLRASADVVVARAVAELRVLIEYTAPFAVDGGCIVLPKGSGLEKEQAAAREALAELGCVVERVERMRPAISGTLRVVVAKRTGHLSARFPRRAGVPGKRPL